MEDVFKAMGDALNPSRQVQTDNDDINIRAKAFRELMESLARITISSDRIDVMIKLANYISSFDKEIYNRIIR